MRKTFALILLLNAVWLESQITLTSINISPSITVGRSLASYSFSGSGTDTINAYITNSNQNVLLTLRSNFVFTQGLYQDSILLDNFSDGFFYFVLTHGHQVFASKQIIKSVLASVNYSEKNSSINIFPNPFKDILKIEFEETPEQNSSLNINNSIGQLVYQKKSTDVRDLIDLSFLLPGIYYLTIENTNYKKHYRIIKSIK